MKGLSAEERWWTIPNAISLVRLGLILPVVILVLIGDRPLLAAILAVVFGATDWVDGFLARRIGQVSRTGAILDVAADRFGILCIVMALVAIGAIPWLVLVVLVAMDIIVAVFTARAVAPHRKLSVSWMGKTRTAVIMASIAAVMFGLIPGAESLLAVGQAGALIGAAIHVVAGAGYVRQLRGFTNRVASSKS